MIGFIALIVAAALAVALIVIGIAVLSSGPRSRQSSMSFDEEGEE